MGAYGTCALQFAADDFLELVQSPLEIVVHDLVVELPFVLKLPLGDLEPLVDLPLALGRAGPEPLLELVAARRRDEDRHRAGDPVAHGERAAGLDLEQRRMAAAGDPLQLRPEGSRAVAFAPRKRHVLEEPVLGEAFVELIVRQEPVVAPVLLAWPAGSRRRRDGKLELRHTLGKPPRKRALALS